MLLNCGVGEDQNPLDCKEIQPVNTKGNRSWIFIGRTDAEDEAPVLRPDVKNWLIGKDSDAGNWRQEEKGMTEDEMVGWHHRLNGREVEEAPGGSDGQRSMACCSTRGHESQARLSDWTTTTIWPKELWGDINIQTTAQNKPQARLRLGSGISRLRLTAAFSHSLWNLVTF